MYKKHVFTFVPDPLIILKIPTSSAQSKHSTATGVEKKGLVTGRTAPVLHAAPVLSEGLGFLAIGM